MFEIVPGVGWLLVAYATGTGFGLFISWHQFGERIVESTIDSLIDNGFLRTRKDANGQIEILKYNEE